MLRSRRTCTSVNEGSLFVSLTNNPISLFNQWSLWEHITATYPITRPRWRKQAHPAPRLFFLSRCQAAARLCPFVCYQRPLCSFCFSTAELFISVTNKPPRDAEVFTFFVFFFFFFCSYLRLKVPAKRLKKNKTKKKTHGCWPPQALIHPPHHHHPTPSGRKQKNRQQPNVTKWGSRKHTRGQQ